MLTTQLLFSRMEPRTFCMPSRGWTTEPPFLLQWFNDTGRSSPSSVECGWAWNDGLPPLFLHCTSFHAALHNLIHSHLEDLS